MAKQNKKQAASVQNRALYSRVSYLYQAAVYLRSEARETDHTRQDDGHATEVERAEDDRRDISMSKSSRDGLSRKLLTDLRATSLKSQIRLSPSIKTTICKYCDTLLVEGETSTSVVENKSKGGRKPWADVLVVKCTTCCGEKRFPVQAARQKRRPHREPKPSEAAQDLEGKSGPSHADADAIMKGD